ncbi:uncharacterized protein LTR77_001923 [Saxophila tyrrhenica]|uniref:FAD-binding domain-containing protein n=1 Tax=Saxophila tyrrhenica TaxID=1690608 RepID=A0AAV9PH44_9PEZI|nr:hypothetical protein LTR77_001923 [Saxophila tyrrhenica]
MAPTTTTFTIIIIGGGIAGLAAAIALARKGHKVTVFEANTSLSELGAGIQIQPNATRVLHHWGLQDEFRKWSNEPAVMKVLQYADSTVIGEIAHNPMQIWEYGYPHWQCYRPDLQRLLYDAAVAAGADVRFGQKVADVDVDQGIVVLADGKREEADLVVAADGILSKFRHLLPGNSDAKAVTCNEYCFRTVVPKERMDSNPETAELMKGEDSMVWVGPGVAVLGYTVSGGRYYNTLISCPTPCEVPVGRWGEPGDVGEARELVKDFCPAVRKIWSYVNETVLWTLGEVPRIASYTSTTGRFVLVGDGAHAIVPHAGQGGGSALEDAAALGEFVSAARDVRDLASKMQMFQDFRQPRMEYMRTMARGNQTFMSLDDGDEQMKRDKMWGKMTAKWKAELAELGEEGFRARPRPRAIPGKDIRSPESRQYMIGTKLMSKTLSFLGHSLILSLFCLQAMMSSQRRRGSLMLMLSV